MVYLNFSNKFLRSIIDGSKEQAIIKPSIEFANYFINEDCIGAAKFHALEILINARSIGYVKTKGFKHLVNIDFENETIQEYILENWNQSSPNFRIKTNKYLFAQNEGFKNFSEMKKFYEDMPDGAPLVTEDMFIIYWEDFKKWPWITARELLELQK